MTFFLVFVRIRYGTFTSTPKRGEREKARDLMLRVTVASRTTCFGRVVDERAATARASRRTFPPPRRDAMIRMPPSPQNGDRETRGSRRRGGGGGGFAMRRDGEDASRATSGRKVCPICQGTGLKPCGQCDGTGVNQEDKYGGKDGYRKGQPCWLCEGKRKTMCGNCVDLTDSF